MKLLGFLFFWWNNLLFLKGICNFLYFFYIWDQMKYFVIIKIFMVIISRPIWLQLMVFMFNRLILFFLKNILVDCKRFNRLFWFINWIQSKSIKFIHFVTPNSNSLDLKCSCVISFLMQYHILSMLKAQIDFTCVSFFSSFTCVSIYHILSLSFDNNSYVTC